MRILPGPVTEWLIKRSTERIAKAANAICLKDYSFFLNQKKRQRDARFCDLSLLSSESFSITRSAIFQFAISNLIRTSILFDEMSRRSLRDDILRAGLRV